MEISTNFKILILTPSSGMLFGIFGQCSDWISNSTVDTV